jgi:hypothetical protein
LLPEPSPEAVERGSVRSDIAYLKVRGGDYDPVALRISGRGRWTGGWTAYVRHGPITFHVRDSISRPVQYHHIVLKEPRRTRLYRARLRLRKEGLLRRRVVGAVWQGGPLAASLNVRWSLRSSLKDVLQPWDGLRILPDVKNRCIRIVFSRPVIFRTGRSSEFEVQEDTLPPKEIIEEMDSIARLVRRH